jgi:hypothetical protein
MDQFRHTLPTETVPDTPAGLFAFPSSEHIAAAAAMFPGAVTALTSLRWRRRGRYEDYPRDISEYRDFNEGVFAQLLVGPGSVKLRRRNDAAHDRTLARLADLRSLRKSDLLRRPLEREQAILRGEYIDAEWLARFPRPLTKLSAQLLGEWEPDQFNVIRRWSRKSRNNMKLTVSQLDLAPLLAEGPPVMITYTLPGAWLDVTPNAVEASRIWNHYRTLWDRTFGAPRCIWKREFQGRGAPHWHEWTVLPVEPAGWSCCRGRGVECQKCSAGWSDYIAGMVSELWTRALFGDLPAGDCNGSCDTLPDGARRPIACRGCERSRSLIAGTNISYSKGASARDPRRLATYFLKESGGGSKEYQNWAPKEWAGQSVGRFWGVRGIDKAVSVIDVDLDDSYAVWRAIRKLRESQRRADSRRVRVKSSAGFALVNDGAAVAGQLARLVASRHGAFLGSLAGWSDRHIVLPWSGEIVERIGGGATKVDSGRSRSAAGRFHARKARVLARQMVEEVFENFKPPAHVPSRT